MWRKKRRRTPEVVGFSPSLSLSCRCEEKRSQRRSHLRVPLLSVPVFNVARLFIRWLADRSTREREVFATTILGMGVSLPTGGRDQSRASHPRKALSYPVHVPHRDQVCEFQDTRYVGAVIPELLRIGKKLRWLGRDCANLVATFEGRPFPARVFGKALASKATKDCGGFRIISKSLGVYTECV